MGFVYAFFLPFDQCALNRGLFVSDKWFPFYTTYSRNVSKRLNNRTQGKGKQTDKQTNNHKESEREKSEKTTNLIRAYFISCSEIKSTISDSFQLNASFENELLRDNGTFPPESFRPIRNR